MCFLQHVTDQYLVNIVSWSIGKKKVCWWPSRLLLPTCGHAHTHSLPLFLLLSLWYTLTHTHTYSPVYSYTPTWIFCLLVCFHTNRTIWDLLFCGLLAFFGSSWRLEGPSTCLGELTLGESCHGKMEVPWSHFCAQRREHGLRDSEGQDWIYWCRWYSKPVVVGSGVLSTGFPKVTSELS